MFAGVAAVSAGGGGGGLAYSKLVYPQTALWRDDTAPDGVLSPMVDFQIGATYTVELTPLNAIAPVPAADAVYVSGGNFRRGAGFGTLTNDTYILDVRNNLSGKWSRTFVDIISTLPAFATVSTAGELATALTNLAATISGTGAAFAGAAIDLNPAANFGDITITQFPDATFSAMLRKVVIRSADVTGVLRPRVKALSFPNQRGLRFQYLDRRWDTSIPNQAELDNNNNSPGCSMVACNWRGGSVVYDAVGAASYNPDLPLDYDSLFLPGYSCLYGQFASGTYSRIDLYRGHLATAENGAAVGVWQAATVPAFIGQNFSNAAINSGTRPLAPGQSCILNIQPRLINGTGFAGRFEIGWLDDTPRTFPNGGANRVKPAGGPDGIYILAWILDAGGSGYIIGSSGVVDARGSLTWAGAVFGVNGVQITANRTPRNFTYSRCRWEGLSQGHRYTFNANSGSVSLLGCSYDGCYLDYQQFIVDTGCNNLLTPFRMWFTSMTRGLSRADDWNNTHGDGAQKRQGGSATGGLEFAFEDVGNLLWNYGARGVKQGQFASDLWRVNGDRGYHYNGLGNVYGFNNTNQHLIQALASETTAYTMVVGRMGGSQGDRFTLAGRPVRMQRDRTLYVSLSSFHQPSLAGGRVEQEYLDHRAFLTNDATRFAAPSLDALTSYEWSAVASQLRTRWTPIGLNAGWGPFTDVEQIIDHANMVFDPNFVPWRPLLPPKLNVALSTVITSDAVIQNVRKTSRLTAISGGEYSISTSTSLDPAVRQADALDGPWSSAVPVDIPYGAALAFRATSSAFATTRSTVNYTLDGVEQSWFARTQVTGPLGPPEPEALPTLTSATGVGSGVNSQDPLDVIPLASPVSVPDGGLLLVFVGFDDDPANISLNGDTDWELLASAVTNNIVDSAMLQVYAYRNRTGAAVNKTLRINMNPTNTFAQHWNSARYLFAANEAGKVVDFISSSAAIGFGTTPNPPPVDLDANRNFTCVAGFACEWNELPADPAGLPSGFNTRVGLSGHANSSAAASLFTARANLTNNTVDPGAFTITNARNWAAATVAVFQRAP